MSRQNSYFDVVINEIRKLTAEMDDYLANGDLSDPDGQIVNEGRSHRRIGFETGKKVLGNAESEMNRRFGKEYKLN